MVERDKSISCKTRLRWSDQGAKVVALHSVMLVSRLSIQDYVKLQNK